MTFTFTDADTEIDSSAVYEAYYNADTSELAVVLQSGTAYVYDGVPKHAYETLIQTGWAKSPGRYYAKTIKREYGPGRSLGHVGHDNATEFVRKAAPVATAGTPKGLTYAPNATVDGVRFDADGGATFTGTVGTLTLTPVVQGNNLRTFDVEFEVGDKVRTHTVKAESFGEAEAAVLEIGAMLDLEFNVKGIRVVE